MVARKKDEPTTTKNQTTTELKDDRAIVITRAFNGPAHIVFDAYTKAEHVSRWFAPKSRKLSMVSCDADVRAGGAYRYVLGRDGVQLAFSGKYLEVSPHSRLVYTQVFEPMAAAGEAVITTTFEERAGKTWMTSSEVYPSKEVRQTVLESGMEAGMLETLDLLDDLVAELARS